MTHKLTSKLTIRGARADELERIGAGIARAFFEDNDRGAQWMRDAWAGQILRRPGFDPAMCRVAFLHGNLIAHVLVEFFTLRYGKARIKVAGIGKVYTERGYRKRGYGAELMRSALAYAVEQGAEIALLNGITGYYDQFGFSSVLPLYTAEFHTHQAAALTSPLKIRAPTDDEIPQIAALYERHWGARVTFTRSAETWIWRITDGDDARRVMVVSGEGGLVEGYFAARSPLSSEVEIVAETHAAVQTFLSYFGRLHQHTGNAVFQWLAPPDDVLIDMARRDVAVRVSAHYMPDGGWMARLLDANALFRSILPELIDQARFMFPRLQMDSVILDYRQNAVQIGIRNQPGTFSHLHPRDFVRVMFGSLSPLTLGLREGLTPQSLQVLQAFFPPRVAALGYWDWF